MGPSVGFSYGAFTDAMVDRVESILVEAGGRDIQFRRSRKERRRIADADFQLDLPESGRTARMGLVIEGPGKRAPFETPAYREAFLHEIGVVPAFELDAYCVSNDSIDWKGLRLLADRIVASLGGWMILEQCYREALPDLPRGVELLDPGVHEVVVREEPERRFWVIDARLGASHWVTK